MWKQFKKLCSLVGTTTNKKKLTLGAKHVWGYGCPHVSMSRHPQTYRGTRRLAAAAASGAPADAADVALHGHRTRTPGKPHSIPYMVPLLRRFHWSGQMKHFLYPYHLTIL